MAAERLSPYYRKAHYKAWIPSLFAALFANAMVTWPAFAQPRTAVLKGECTKIVAGDRQLKAEYCASKVINMTLPNGREGFMFMLQKPGEADIVIGFFGDGRREIHKDADHVVLPIDSVNLSFNGTNHTAAAGSCLFANPNRGVSVPVSCSADTKDGKFVGEFMSDGSEWVGDSSRRK